MNAFVFEEFMRYLQISGCVRIAQNKFVEKYVVRNENYYKIIFNQSEKGLEQVTRMVVKTKEYKYILKSVTVL